MTEGAKRAAPGAVNQAAADSADAAVVAPPLANRRKFDAFPYLLLLPALILTAVIVAWPLFETFRLSFTNASLRPVENYIGFENYIEIFEDDFGEIIARTFLWMGLGVSFKIIMGVIGAVLLNAALPGRSVFRVLIMPPWVVPIAIGVFMWSWMYNGQFGMISGLGQRIGLLDGPFEFMAYRQSAFIATIVTDVWIGTPLVSLYLLAAMQSIPKELYEAAWTDGASRFYRFRRITLPLIAPSIFTMALLSAIWTFNSFDIIWILTEGGPRGATETMIIDTYKTAISRFRFGEGAARAVMILVCLTTMAALYLTLAARMNRGDKPMIDKYSFWEKVGLYAAITVFLIFILAPFFEAFLVSLRPLDEIFQVPYRVFTDNMSFRAYIDMWTNVPGLWRYILNSFFISIAVTVLALFCIIPAAYSFSRFSYGGRDGLLTAFLAINMVGAAVLIIPLYKLMLALGLLNSYFAMILPGAAFLVPTGIFLMRSYFLRIPKELEDAAYVDGASRLYTLWRVILPVALPGIMVVSITVFIGAYAQQFLFALTFNSVDSLHPLPVGLFQFFGRDRILWNELMAASLVGTLPVLLVYIFLQRYIVAGLTAGAVKE